MAEAIARGKFDAAEFVEAVRRQWKGWEWDADEPPVTVLEDVRLVSSSEEWPPDMDIRFRIGTRAGRWPGRWDVDMLRTEPLDAAVGLWGAIVYYQLMDLKRGVHHVEGPEFVARLTDER